MAAVISYITYVRIIVAHCLLMNKIIPILKLIFYYQQFALDCRIMINPKQLHIYKNMKFHKIQYTL